LEWEKLKIVTYRNEKCDIYRLSNLTPSSAFRSRMKTQNPFSRDHAPRHLSGYLMPAALLAVVSLVSLVSCKDSSKPVALQEAPQPATQKA
jgi:hypothetical protein